MAARIVARRNLTPPQVAEQLGVATAKVITFIRNPGELRAMNLANRGCTLLRYSITPEALEQFERGCQAVPYCELSTTKRLRRQSQTDLREYVWKSPRAERAALERFACCGSTQGEAL